MVNKNQRARLKTLAQKIGHEQWLVDGDRSHLAIDSDRIYALWLTPSQKRENNLSYIGAANPQTILDLIDDIELLEKEIDWLAEQLLCCIDDNRVDTCRYVECRHLCANTTIQDWREAARNAVEEKSE